MKAVPGTVVSLEFCVTDDDGMLVDSSEGQPPYSYVHGRGNLLPALERVLEGAEVGFKAEVVLEPKDAYGEHRPDAVVLAPLESFPPGSVVLPGMEVGLHTSEGLATFKVISTDEDGVLLDANHPLAGKRLHFYLQVVDVRPASDEDQAGSSVAIWNHLLSHVSLN